LTFPSPSRRLSPKMGLGEPRAMWFPNFPHVFGGDPRQQKKNYKVGLSTLEVCCFSLGPFNQLLPCALRVSQAPALPQVLSSVLSYICVLMRSHLLLMTRISQWSHLNMTIVSRSLEAHAGPGQSQRGGHNSILRTHSRFCAAGHFVLALFGLKKEFPCLKTALLKSRRQTWESGVH
jgi:hypothetical protein